MNIVILDACRDNPLPKRKRSGARGLAVEAVPSVQGIVMLYSAGPGEAAEDGPPGSNGLFTGELLKVIDLPGLTLEQVFKQTVREVNQATRGRQTPWINTSLTGDFYFAPASAASESTVGIDDDALFWQSIQSSRQVLDFEAYLAQFPEGTFAPLARAKIRSLKGETVASQTPPTASVAPAVVSPTPSYTVTDGRETKWVSGRGTVIVRLGPGTNSMEVGRLDSGDEVSVTGRVDGSEWVRVALANGGTGFVYGSLLGDAKPSKPVVVAPPVTLLGPANSRDLTAGMVFRDCENELVATSGVSVPEGAFCGPELVVIPPGSFMMGSTSGDSDEQPVHKVDIGYPFAVGRYEVTRGEFARFVEETVYDAGKGCWVLRSGKWLEDPGSDWRSPGYSQTDAHPVACLNWNGATSFVTWLSRKTGQRYRLLTESEWEYVARAGTTTKRYWGNSEAGCDYANAGDLTLKAADPGWKHPVSSCQDGFGIGTAPVGTKQANGLGLYDILGNVWEWVEDCWNGNYSGAPTNGSANRTEDCRKRVLRGGSWVNHPVLLRSAIRNTNDAVNRYSNLGFRIARTL